MNMQSAFESLSWPGILLAALSAFALGGLWYSPLMFVKIWAREANIDMDPAKRGSMVKIFGLSFLLSLVAAFFLAMFIGADQNASFGAIAGFLAGTGWVFTFLGIFYLFEGKSLAHFLINACYSIVSLTIMGLIIGAMQ
jgi:hypothetical protein